MVRNPVQCIPSTLKLVEVSWASKGWNRQDYLPALRALTEISFDSFDLPRQALAAHPKVPHAFVDYRDLTRAPRETVEEVYEALGIDLSAEFRAVLEALEEKEKSHSSHFEYSIEDYEVGALEIESRLASHYERYDWPRAGEGEAASDTEEKLK